MHTLVIGEAGSCHDGYFEKAIGLLDVIKDAGADVAKFQFWSSAQRLADRRRAHAYRWAYDQYSVPAEWLPRLKAACDRRGIEFMCTTYLPEDIAVVAPYVGRFKIASFEAADVDFVQAHAAYDKPILMSTGMVDRAERYDLHVCPNIQMLHCVSAYPAPIDEANLAVLRLRPGGEVRMYEGLSDHTRHVMTGAFAVCAGATIVETHVRDWGTAKDNPDYGTALDPYEFSVYVQNIRMAEAMLGDGVKRLMPSETAMAAYRVVA